MKIEPTTGKYRKVEFGTVVYRGTRVPALSINGNVVAHLTLRGNPELLTDWMILCRVPPEAEISIKKLVAKHYMRECVLSNIFKDVEIR